jgi:CDP-diacylglycerol--glycerol-3-phosphate 3-phosphatidyltransferase
VSAQEQRLLARLLARRGAGGVCVREYGRGGWEFHAKGVWVVPPASEVALPVATVLGSSNYGARSCRRDVEAQLALITRHDGLRAALGREWDRLAAHAPHVALPQLAARARRVGARLAAHAAARWM